MRVIAGCLRFPALAISGEQVFLPSADLEIGQETFTHQGGYACLPLNRTCARGTCSDRPSSWPLDSKGRLYHRGFEVLATR